MQTLLSVLHAEARELDREAEVAQEEESNDKNGERTPWCDARGVQRGR